jgi:hypothetical protein
VRVIRRVLLGTSGAAGTLVIMLSTPKGLAAGAAVAIVLIVVVALCWTLADKQRSLRLAMLIRALRSNSASSSPANCQRGALAAVPEPRNSIRIESARETAQISQ